MESKFKFLTKYSFNKKVKNKWFLIGNIIVAILIIGLVNIDSIIKVFGGDFSSDINIKVVDNTGYYNMIEDNLNIVKSYYVDNKVTITKESKDLKDIKKEVKDKDDIILVINEDAKNAFNVSFITDSYIDMIKYQLIENALNNVKKNILFEKYGLDSEKIKNLNTSVVIKREFINKDKTKDEESSKTILSFASLFLVLPCFILLVFLIQMIGSEINEEKSTRGMEIIIGNVSYKTHFFAKILASNLFVLMQSIMLVIYSVVGIIIRKLTVKESSIEGLVSNLSSDFDVTSIMESLKNSDIIERLNYIIPLLILLFVLSFLAYSLLAGILASMTTNMENFQQLQTPLVIISVIGYYLIFISTTFPGSLFIKIASTIPLISLSLTPSLILSGEISSLTLIIGIILLSLLDYLLIKYGLRIYKVGILNYSESNLWKKMFKAVKSK